MRPRTPAGLIREVGGTEAAMSVFVDARKSMGLAGVPQPGSVSPHLFLGKKNNSRSKEGLDTLVTEELVDSYGSVASQTASSTQINVRFSYGIARRHTPVEAHPQQTEAVTGVLPWTAQ